MRTKNQLFSRVLFFSVMFLLYFHVTFSGHAYGVWSDDPTVNTPVCTANGDQSFPRIINDGSGGAIITWGDPRSGNFDIYAQRVNSAGVAQWTADGVAICTASGDQKVSGIISDGSGGAIITWSDVYGYLPDNIYAQRVNSAGVSQWTADGVAIRAASDWEYDAQIISDVSGGAIITWGDSRNGNFDIYAQRINSSGVAQWTADGVAICTAGDLQQHQQIVSDDSGGAIITWSDPRSGNFDIYAQRVNSSGVALWTADGVAVCTASDDQLHPKIISDGSRGAIIAWRDNRSGDVHIYTQRIDKYGVTQWTGDGVAVCMASDSQFDHQTISDGSGGAIITWDDDRNGNWDIYAQRINYKGAMEWAANGVAISASVGSQNDSQIVMDGTGGGVIIWEDYRNGYGDIYTQRIDKYGVTQWTLDGVAVCTAYFDQNHPMIINDGSGATIITWTDDRRWRDYDIYAQKVKKDGTLADTLKSLFILPLLLFESND